MVDVVIQPGCSSGRELDYFARKHPNVQFIGTEIDDSLVSYLREQYSVKNLTFCNKFAHEIDTLYRECKSVCVLVSGSFQYVFPEHIDVFFERLPTDKDVFLLITEPVQALGGDPTAIEGSRLRGQFSYIHNYKYYAQKHDFVIDKLVLIDAYKDNPDKQSLTYYMLASRAAVNEASL